MAVRAYAFGRWPRVGRAEAIELRHALRALPALFDGAHGALLHEAEKLFELPCGACAKPAALVTVAELCARLEPPWLAVLLDTQDGEIAPVLVELPGELAARLVDRVLGGEGTESVAPVGRLDAMSQGVLAYAAARLLAPTALRVRDVIDEPGRLPDLLGRGRVLVWPIELRVGRQAGQVRLLVPPAALHAPQRVTGRAATRPRLAHLEVTLCAHAARCALTPAQLRSLCPGDVVVPERCGLAQGPQGFSGELTLHVLGCLRAGFHAHARGNEVVLGAVLTYGDSTVTEGKRIPAESSEPQPAAVLLEDVPIELCLELARFSLSLGELAALRPGEVLATGRLLGERATLSASGKPVARGELVDVDGEIGLRILEVLNP